MKKMQSLLLFAVRHISAVCLLLALMMTLPAYAGPGRRNHYSRPPKTVVVKPQHPKHKKCKKCKKCKKYKKCKKHHCPKVGTVVITRPAHGRYCYYGNRRYWLADNVLYDIVKKGTGVAYVVVRIIGN